MLSDSFLGRPTRWFGKGEAGTAKSRVERASRSDYSVLGRRRQPVSRVGRYVAASSGNWNIAHESGTKKTVHIASSRSDLADLKGGLSEARKVMTREM